MSLLMDRGKTLITVALNEAATKAENKNVPYSPEEIAEAAVECEEAGACAVHIHSRSPSGSQVRRGSALYRRAFELTALESDVLMWTTAYPLGPDPTCIEELDHQWELVDRPPRGAPLELGCFDCFRIGRRPYWDSISQKLLAVDSDYRAENDGVYELPPVLAETLRRRLVPIISCYDCGDARWASYVANSGLIPTSLIQLHMLGGLLIGPSPTADALRAYVAEAKCEGGSETSFAPAMFDDRSLYEQLLGVAIKMGAHIRVGLGDSARLYPTSTNAELVSRAVDLVQSVGLEPATPADMRRHFRIPERMQVPIGEPGNPVDHKHDHQIV